MEHIYDETARIVDQIQQGSDEAFDRLYELTKRMVYFELKSAGVCEADTEDVLQETYIKIYNKINTIEDVQASYKWIKQIAYRTGINYVKSSIVSHEQLSAEGEENIFESEDSLTSPLPMPEDIMQNKESQRLVREILQGLPSLQYKMIVAYYYNESSVKEIAEDFDVPEGTVKTNLFRARAEIKTKVEELEKKHGIKLYTVAALPLFSFFMDTETQAAELPAFMRQDTIMQADGVRGAGVPEEVLKADLAGAPKSVMNADTQFSSAAPAVGEVVVKKAGLSLITKLLIAIVSSVLLLGTVAVVAVVVKQQQSADEREERVLEREENDEEDDDEDESAFKVTVGEETEEEENAEKAELTEELTEEETEGTEKTEVTEEKKSALNHEGEVLLMTNHFDGTYTMKISKEARISGDILETAALGDIITTDMGDRYVFITLQDLYTGYYGEGDYGNGYAVRPVGEEVFGYELQPSADGFRLLDPENGVYMMDGLQNDGVSVKIAENAEIKLLSTSMETETISVPDFINMDWNGTSGYGRILPMPVKAKIVDGQLVYLEQVFVP